MGSFNWSFKFHALFCSIFPIWSQQILGKTPILEEDFEIKSSFDIASLQLV